ncbi:hypothetical protein SAMD00019534_057740 [Acytostelium subglobosum LB1]|uniref:hypothetical protein n=1 Tax=Acytostelium subglobosum LB1 TaxID=1410327 RepID=UPI000644926C|nr:hypothetical protein SAMD00019534_057740 [Acytostelium subglobosum LB1]GAM22599.1 hypothetical protein SAMD00019534_057740 [Acytostelium subglobosum LB1]|eukprot:XP_012754719.1 hypothetical protein SAMD00019534_057740 [Acytostelium subglobosum LB1]
MTEPAQTSPTLQGKKKKEQPEWFPPQGVPSELMIYNSLTSSKNAFIPSSGGNFDIIRRIMKDYLGYDVQYVMNITDIDDKIIDRANKSGVTHTELSRKWEASFFEDLKALNVLPPDALTRVTEYVPEIITYVQKIISNGYAYESNGSVYFDTESFKKNHEYGKLEPSSVGNEKLISEGEGALTVGTQDKKNKSDFALWKVSKPGEPEWSSPWGPGRPGWHIECSAMASDILGPNIDIHSGGEDLKFPHHDNEIAQSEAHYGCKQWINYFIHSGHLLIDGLKMSKSLKNFITIQAALEKYTARQIRMLFLIHKYDKPMNYSQESMTNVFEIEKIFSEFFHTVKSVLRDSPGDLPQSWNQVDKDLNAHLLAAKKNIHSYLLDNFNTVDVMHSLTDLIKKTNIYLADKSRNPRVAILTNIANYITYILRVFGVVDTSSIGFGSGEGNVEEALKPVLDATIEFRNQMRTAAAAKDTSKILQTCDSFRDEVLPLLGIKIDDKQGGSVWKFEDKEVLKKEMLLKKEIEAKKQAEKEERAKKEAAKLEKAKIPPSDMFKAETSKYSQFDARGVPTHDNTGAEITKSQKKKLDKEFDEQTKSHSKYLESLKQ